MSSNMPLRRIAISRLMVVTALQMLTTITSAMVLPMHDASLSYGLANGSSHPRLKNEVPICVYNSDWGQEIHNEDCHIVLNYMYNYYRFHLFYTYEFTEVGVSHPDSKHLVRTPLKIHHGNRIPTLR